MNCKVLMLLLVLIHGGVHCEEVEDDLSDFDFNNEDHAEEETGGLFDENDVDYEDEDLSTEQPEELGGAFSMREAMVRQIILNSMKSQEMKDKMARVLPILRVMTPNQKLALATLVTTQVLTPSTSKGLTLEDVSALFGNNPNTTAELMLPISLDVANLFRRTARSEKGPIAEELRGAPPMKKHLRGPGVYRRNIIDRSHNKYLRRKPIKPANKEPINCELFTANICLKSHDYPIEAIMSSIRRNKHAMSALLTDVKSPADGNSDQPNSDLQDTKSPEEFNEVRRTAAESGFMCPSLVRYARPQKARATSGQWKYIVNTVEHTQTLRLERCLNAGDTCTYLTDNFKSRCVQVYNYHRLLTWDQTNGLHMDIFKVPTCCSCHIDSYKVPFPPHHANHATTSENFPGEDIIEHDLSPTTEETNDPYSNSISGSNNHFRKEFPQNVEFHDSESTKIRPATVERPGLPKYLEAPKPIVTFNKQNINHNYKRNTPKPLTNTNKRPTRPVRRRPPTKPVRDLAQSESNFALHTTETPTTATILANTKKINYNYHPIIDFFKPDTIESRMDMNLGDSDWKPVTSMLLATERSFRKR